MAEDWNAIAREVDAAIRSVADISQSGGYPAALRLPPAGAPANPWDPPSGPPTYSTVYVLDGVREIRDITGTTVLETLRTLLISATGARPAKGQAITVGLTAEQAQAGNPNWFEIGEIRPLAPAGIAVLYEVDLIGGTDEMILPSDLPMLDFSIAANSQYVPLLFEDF